MNNESTEDGEVDLYNDMPATKLFNKFNDTWCDQVLEIPKWKEKLAKCEELLSKISSAPKVDGKGHLAVLKMCKKLIKEKNQNIEFMGVKIIGKLAKNVRDQLGNSGKKISALIVEKLKNRSNRWSTIALEALKDCFYVSPPQNIVEKLKEMTKQKNIVFNNNLVVYLTNY